MMEHEMRTSNSLMVVLDKEEYCFLYDRPSLPDVIESLLENRDKPEQVEEGYLDVDQALEVSRGILSKAYQQL